MRAHARAADFVEEVGNRDEVAAILAAPNRIGVTPEVIRRTLDGRLKVSPDGAVRTDDRYLLVGRDGAGRPDPVQAAWLYAQMVRWGQAPLSDGDAAAAAKAVFRPDLYDAALPAHAAARRRAGRRHRRFHRPAFDPERHRRPPRGLEHQARRADHSPLPILLRCTKSSACCNAD